jgi:hypothetical protein
MEFDKESLERFILLARKGKCKGSSGGERRAAKLAEVIVEQVPGLDEVAMQGLLEFVRLAHASPVTAGDLIEP